MPFFIKILQPDCTRLHIQCYNFSYKFSYHFTVVISNMTIISHQIAPDLIYNIVHHHNLTFEAQKTTKPKIQSKSQTTHSILVNLSFITIKKSSRAINYQNHNHSIKRKNHVTCCVSLCTFSVKISQDMLHISITSLCIYVLTRMHSTF